jgi:hypothetical protein
LVELKIIDAVNDCQLFFGELFSDNVLKATFEERPMMFGQLPGCFFRLRGPNWEPSPAVNLNRNRKATLT